jgi:hypothetical protein
MFAKAVKSKINFIHLSNKIYYSNEKENKHLINLDHTNHQVMLNIFLIDFNFNAIHGLSYLAKEMI